MVMCNPKVYIFSFYLEGVAGNGKKRETFFEGNSSASDPEQDERWVCLEIRCWKGEPNGGVA